MGKVVCIVQARTGSQRYPLKIFAGLFGRPMISHVLERAAKIKGVDQVVLAMPHADVRMSEHLWPYVFGGKEKDVLHRYYDIAYMLEAKTIIRITGDCPLLAPDLASYALEKFHYHKCDYAAMCQPYSPVADGWDVEIFSARALINAQEQATKDQREHVTTWMRDAGFILMFDQEQDGIIDSTALKCSVDTREDLQRVEKIMAHLEDQRHTDSYSTWAAWEKAGRP